MRHLLAGFVEVANDRGKSEESEGRECAGRGKNEDQDGTSPKGAPLAHPEAGRGADHRGKDDCGESTDKEQEQNVAEQPCEVTKNGQAEREGYIGAKIPSVPVIPVHE